MKKFLVFLNAGLNANGEYCSSMENICLGIIEAKRKEDAYKHPRLPYIIEDFFRDNDFADSNDYNISIKELNELPNLSHGANHGGLIKCIGFDKEFILTIDSVHNNRDVRVNYEGRLIRYSININNLKQFKDGYWIYKTTPKLFGLLFRNN